MSVRQTKNTADFRAGTELREQINEVLRASAASPRDQVEALMDYALSTAINYKEECCTWNQLREQLLGVLGDRFDRMVVVKESWRAAA